MRLAAVVALAAVWGWAECGPVDQHATAETRRLLEMLRTVAANQSQIMFGQKDCNRFGAFGGHAPYATVAHNNVQAWEYTQDNAEHHVPMDLGDVKLLTGDHPAVTGFDFGGYQDPNHLVLIKTTADDAVKKNMLVVMTQHISNLATGNSFYIKDDQGDVLHSDRRILPGGDHNANFHQYLDKVASWAHNFTDSKGRLAPFVFRPWHELNGDWFWWGLNNKAQNSAQDLQELYRHTVRYLRDVKGVHNILYAFSPDKFKNQGDYLSIYPGDDYVDIMGMDYYFSKEGCCKNDFKRMATDVVTMAEKHGKVAAVTEVGIFENSIDTFHDFWSNYIMVTLKSSPVTRRLAYLLTWTNRCGSQSCEYWVPYKGHPAEADFLKFYNDPATVFSSEAPRFYA